jgi:sugar/nucleoside kinase (ribokinase family)
VTAGRVVVLGDVMLDVVAVARAPLARASDTPAAVSLSGGGAGANVAAWLAELGVPVTLVARVGDDAAGRDARADLTRRGVDVRAAVDPERPTGTCVVLVEPGGERTMLPDRGANLALAARDVPDGVLAAPGHLHLSGYALLDPGPRAAALHALAAARGAGMTISVDPASAAPLAAAGPEVVLGWLAGVDLLLPNRDEAAVLTGREDPVEAALELARTSGAREVVVTCGAGGSVWTDGSRVKRAAAAPAAVVDTTGAGDAFAAGLLAARRAGLGPEAALARAGLTAARALGRAGARTPSAG